VSATREGADPRVGARSAAVLHDNNGQSNTVDSNVIAYDTALRQARDARDALNRWARGEIPTAILGAVLVEAGRAIRCWNALGDIDLVRERVRRER